MALQDRITKLERKHRKTGPVFVIVQSNETPSEALLRCHPGEKPEQVLYLDPCDVRA